MSQYSYTTRSIDELDDIVSRLIILMRDYKLFLFEGDLGLGKTTLVKQWMGAIGVQDMVSSPSYAIVNEYQLDALPIYHIDCYRMNTVEEALEVGIEEYFYSGHLCLIEWPDLIKDIIPKSYAEIQIQEGVSGQREYLITAINESRG